MYKPFVDVTPVVIAQRAVAADPEFKDSVAAVESYPYNYGKWGQIYEAYFKKFGKPKKSKKRVGKSEGKGGNKPGFKETEFHKIFMQEQEMAVSNREYHYFGNAPSFLMIGDAFAEAMVELMEK